MRGHDETGTRVETKKLQVSTVSQQETRTPRFGTNPLGYLRSLRFRHKQNTHQLTKRRIGAPVHFIQLDRADRMLHDQHRVVRRAEGFLFRLG